MSFWELYLITRLTPISSFLTVSSVVLTFVTLLGLIALVIVGFGNDTVKEEDKIHLFEIKIFKILFMISIIAWPISLIASGMVPTTAEFLAIDGISIVSNNERIKVDGNKLLLLLERKIDIALKEGSNKENTK